MAVSDWFIAAGRGYRARENTVTASSPSAPQPRCRAFFLVQNPRDLASSRAVGVRDGGRPGRLCPFCAWWGPRRGPGGGRAGAGARGRCEGPPAPGQLEGRGGGGGGLQASGGRGAEPRHRSLARKGMGGKAAYLGRDGAGGGLAGVRSSCWRHWRCRPRAASGKRRVTA